MDKDLEDVNKRSGTRKVWKSVLNPQIIERGVYTTISFWKGIGRQMFSQGSMQ